ncbi:hypothetical protein CC78DRAFT_384061 [Lojkania enalia]|uniref:Uncharacterized protein n=1 Tax=Lojkania enalia TaxID=147567 RepID=A0A9P4N6R3_9PLEO|nr:hypothetical protein CC78DRAFT_384061 [Didymosphaeria enalia]
MICIFTNAYIHFRPSSPYHHIPIKMDTFTPETRSSPSHVASDIKPAKFSLLITPPPTDNQPKSTPQSSPSSTMSKEYLDPSFEADEEDDVEYVSGLKQRSNSKKLSAKRRPADQLQQLQYRSYRYPITIYHFSDYLMPFRDFKNGHQKSELGYVHSLIGPDPQYHMPVEEGDKLPPGRFEVAYLPNVFQHKGCAVGFRDGTFNKIEWLCFRSPIQTLLEEASAEWNEPVFDKVAILEKGGTGVKGHPEHRRWFESVQNCRIKNVRLKLKLKGHNWDGCTSTVGGLVVIPFRGKQECKAGARLKIKPKQRYGLPTPDPDEQTEHVDEKRRIVDGFY